jgi:vacuolar-type H+-ATPase subunit I/STV1
MKRQGADKGHGSGYRNLRHYPKDPAIHAQSAKGLRQAQRLKGIEAAERNLKVTKSIKNLKFGQLNKKGITLSYQGDKDHDGVPNIKDCRPLNPKKHKDMPVTEVDTMLEGMGNTEQKPSFLSKVGSGLATAGKAVGKAAVTTGKFAYSEGKKELKRREEERQKKRVEELKSIKHPDVVKLEKQRERVEELEKEADDPYVDEGEQNKLIQELEQEREQLRQLQEKATEIKLEDLNDSDLKQLAIRHKADSGFFSDFFGTPSNQYKDELLRRIKVRKELNRDVQTAEKAPLEKKGLF